MERKIINPEKTTSYYDARYVEEKNTANNKISGGKFILSNDGMSITYEKNYYFDNVIKTEITKEKTNGFDKIKDIEVTYNSIHNTEIIETIENCSEYKVY